MFVCLQIVSCTMATLVWESDDHIDRGQENIEAVVKLPITNVRQYSQQFLLCGL